MHRRVPQDSFTVGVGQGSIAYHGEKFFFKFSFLPVRVRKSLTSFNSVTGPCCIG